jgi:flagellar hook-basal body complex protein FliE
MKPLPVSPGDIQYLPESVQPASGRDSAAQFKNVLGRYINEVNDLQNTADKAVRDLAAGKMDNLHQVIMAVNEADLSFRLMMEIRNRLVDAYREIMRMQV